MPIPNKTGFVENREKLMMAIKHAAISLIQTNTSRFNEEMMRERMRRVADDLILASEEVGSEQ